MSVRRPFQWRGEDYLKLRELHRNIEKIEGKVPLVDIPSRWVNSAKVWNATLEDSQRRVSERLRRFKK